MVWGSKDIHVGIYKTPEDSIVDASHRTVQKMAETLKFLSTHTYVLDIGSGYGGAARYLAHTYGCKVVCLNLSERQNGYNRQMNQEQNVSHLVEVVDGSFDAIPYPENTFDVVWSQDALLHSGNRRQVMEEVRRVLKLGGEMIFTDIMQSDDCPEGVIQLVFDNIPVPIMGSVAFYRQTALDLGFTEVQFTPMLKHFVTHYVRVRQEFELRYDELARVISKHYLDNIMHRIIHNNIDGGNKGYLNWGMFHIL
jgi:sarcosine/dimethylglycine N-methyltransferase